MFINARPDALGLIGGTAQRAPVQPTSTATAVAPASRAGRREGDPEQLRFFLSNITRADASAVMALTEKAQGHARAHYDAVVSAYSDA